MDELKAELQSIEDARSAYSGTSGPLYGDTLLMVAALEKCTLFLKDNPAQFGDIRKAIIKIIDF
jgi:hypothetical protein